MKRKYIVRLIVFFSLTAFIWRHFADVLVVKSRNQNTAANQEAKNADVVFLGTSQGALGINPQAMWDNQGIMAYNFSGNGQYIGTSYYVLQEILESFSPQVIALDIRSIVKPEDFLSEGNTLYNFTVVSRPWLRYQMYQEIIGQEPIYFSSLLRYHERWKTVTSADFEKRSYVLGAELHPETRLELENLPEAIEVQNTAAIGAREQDYLNKIISLAESKGCKLLFLRMPGEYSEQIEAKVQTLINFGKEKDIQFCDMMSAEFYNESGLQTEDFRDEDHLTIAGADKLSGWLSEYLVENGLACDRRQDDVAAAWELRVEVARKQAWELYLKQKKDFSSYYQQLEKGVGYEAVIVLSGTISEDMLKEIEAVMGYSIRNSEDKVFWMTDGVLNVDDTFNIEKVYDISSSLDMFISIDTGEISVNNRPVKKVDNGINIVVIDTTEEKIIDNVGFDADFIWKLKD